MKVHIKMKNGSAGYVVKPDEDVIRQIVELFENQDVVSITLSRQSPREYIKTATGKEKSYGNH